MEKLPLSVPVITRNEERRLGRCLRSVADMASEIVVVDSGSTDATRAVAESFGAHWITHEWTGFRDQKGIALGHCTQPWVLALDADEELSPAMRAEILSFFRDGSDQRFHGASFPRKVWFLGRWITHGDWYPSRVLRLARREGARSGGTPDHDKLEVDGPVLKCRGDIYHYSFPDMASYVDKINFFASEYAKRQAADGRRWSLAETLFRPAWRFFRGYVLRRGFLDGFPGLWIAWSTAYQTFVRHSRLYEYRHGGEPPPGRKA